MTSPARDVALSGPALAVQTCARRLAPLGATCAATGGGGLVVELDGAASELDLSWFGPARMGARLGSEAVIQAMSGLMQVHGRDAGGPRRIGLEVASVTTGILAAQAALAGMIGRARGRSVDPVATSVLEAGLLLTSHRVAAATTGSEWVPVPPGPAPGPPFRSADNHWLEIETLDASAWRAFWERLGAGSADLQWAWRLFRPRYFRGTCTLPPGLHEAAGAHAFAAIAAAADACAVSLSRVRSYDEVLAEPGFSAGHPVARALPAPPGPPSPTGPAPAGEGGLPLSGLRVVEATSRLQGPLAGRLLQLLGAHVVRVEPPGGDLSRSVPPAAGDDGTFFAAFNRGKEPVELDLARPQARAELVELIAGADVFLHNWRPGKAAEWGLEADDLAELNPTLVYVHGSGWGDLPGVAHLVGTDFLVQAYTGVGAGITAQGRPPLPSRALLTDYMGALTTCEAALFGLYLRSRSGRGQRLGASLFAGAMALQAHVLEPLAGGAETCRRRGRPLWTALDHPLATADGVLVVSVADADDLDRLCRACGADADGAARADVELRVAERIAGGVSADWEERIAAAGIPCAAACTDLAALPADPRLAGLFERLGGTAWAPVAPWRWAS